MYTTLLKLGYVAIDSKTAFIGLTVDKECRNCKFMIAIIPPELSLL